jgi:Tfp pilus assembly protein PilX
VTDDRGSTIPLILGFFLIAGLLVAGSVALGQAFVQQRALQNVCDGAAAAAAASSADLDREHGLVAGGSLRFTDVAQAVSDYLARDPQRRRVHVNAHLSPGGTRITLTCEQTTRLAMGAVVGRGRVHHTATSTARAAVIG